ncbi:hypothetical protein [Microbacterium sp. YY-01]|uniref:hypothetical protein n=1 Tax=Microbacterium sp. YY-01 TaxID=3421634 RepID=UPI003D170FE8
MPASIASRAAAYLLIAEGVAVATLTIMEARKLFAGEATSLTTALALIALTLVGTVALFAFGIAVLRGGSWGRSGGIVLQLLGLGLVLSALSLRPLPITFMLAIGVPAAITLVLLLAAVRASGRPSGEDHLDGEA